MTDKELRRLSRRELLELLLEQTERNEILCAELKRLNQILAQREIQIQNAGSIAQAALALNEVFEAADRAAQEYLENVRRMAKEEPENG